MGSPSQMDAVLARLATVGRSSSFNTQDLDQVHPGLGKAIEQADQRLSAIEEAVRLVLEHQRRGPVWFNYNDADLFNFEISYADADTNNDVKITHDAGYVLNRWMVTRWFPTRTVTLPAVWGTQIVLVAEDSRSSTFRLSRRMIRHELTCVVTLWRDAFVPIDANAEEEQSFMRFGPTQFRGEGSSPTASSVLGGNEILGLEHVKTNEDLETTSDGVEYFYHQKSPNPMKRPGDHWLEVTT